MFVRNLVQALFWRLKSLVRQSAWCTPRRGRHDPCGLSHSHSCSGTKGRGSGHIGWHLLRVFPAHASSTWRITRQWALPWRHHLKEYLEKGRPRLGAWAFGRCVGRAPGNWWVESSSETLLIAQNQNVFSVWKFSTTVLYNPHRLLLRPMCNEMR